MDAQDEGMGDAGEWRAFALRMLLRELVEKEGTAETAEELRTPASRWRGGSSRAGCAGPWQWAGGGNRPSALGRRRG